MSTTLYSPSSSDKKTAVLVYLLIGSIIILHKDRINSWVWGHTQQALGRWVLCVPIAFISLLLVFIPVLSLLPLFLLIGMIGVWGRFVYQLRQGQSAQQKGGLGVFAQVGAWMTDVMDVSPDIIQEEQDQSNLT